MEKALSGETSSGCSGTGIQNVLTGRSTPEYDAIRANLAAQLPYRAAAKLLAELLPVCRGATYTTLRNRTFSVDEQIITHTSERAAMGSPNPDFSQGRFQRLKIFSRLPLWAVVMCCRNIGLPNGE